MCIGCSSFTPPQENQWVDISEKSAPPTVSTQIKKLKLKKIKTKKLTHKNKTKHHLLGGTAAPPILRLSHEKVSTPH